jgi:arylsulfatase A-like enzyme
MLTGLYHNHHGAESNGMPIRNDVKTVADLLSAQGYRTAAFVSGWTLKNEATHLGTRFERYDENFSPWPLFPDSVTRLALDDRVDP